jgi:FtsP/CotA-like multicopper oxidase with cupredoxin domain
VIGDPTGGIWVERFDVDRTNPVRWRILSPESGAALEVELPPGRQLLSVGSDGLLVLEEDALGVPSLRLCPRIDR